MTAYYKNIVIEDTILVAGNDVTEKLTDIAVITYNTNDILFYNGTNIVGVSPTSYKTTLGLNNVTNNLQVYNLGNARGIQLNTIANRPTASTNGNIFISTDTRTISFDNGSAWSNVTPAYTGDVTSTAGGTTLTLATVNSNIGTFNNLTVNAKGQVTAASNANYLVDPLANGILVRTSLNTTTTRSITNVPNQTVVSNGNGVASNPSIGIADNPVIPGNDSMTIPYGSTAQRGAATVAKFRFNQTLNQYEGVRNSIFAPLGKIVQTFTGTINVTTGTTTQFYNNQIPDETAGFSIFSTVFTPIFNDSLLIIRFSMMVDHSNNNRNIVTIVNVNGVIEGVTATNSGIAGRPANQTLQVAIPSTGAAMNIEIRTGANSGGTTYINRGTTASMGNSAASNITIEEFV